MALTTAEIVIAENDYVASDGIIFNFTRSAILGFIKDRLSVEQVAHSNKIFITLTESSVPKNAGDFGDFDVDDTNCTVTIYENGASVLSTTLSAMTNSGPGSYEDPYIATAGKSVTIRVVIRASFTNPAIPAQGIPLSVESFDIPFFEALTGAGVGGQTIGKVFDPLGEIFSVGAT